MKKIPLTRGLFALVDDNDFEWLNQWEWNCDDKGYAKRNIHVGNNKQTTIKMHRVIMGINIGDKRQVDHINEIKNDNRKINLRVCLSKENSRNRKTNKNNTSGFKGITFKEGRWYARIGVDGKRISLGYFHNLEEAHKAYCIAAKKFHKDFANFGYGCIILKDKNA